MKLRRILLSASLLVAGSVACSGGSSPTTPATPASTRVISLSGSLAFGSVTVGQSADRNLTIANSGNSPLTVTGITGPTGLSANWTSGSIPAGGSQVVTVKFSPTAAQAYSGTVTVAGDQTSGTNSVAFSGTGVAPAGTRIISLSGSLSFGTVPVGQSSERSLTIANTGNLPLTVTCVTVPTGFTSSWTGGSIAAGLSQLTVIRFTPSAAQSYSGTVTVCADHTSGTNTSAISGTGSAAPLQPPVINVFSVSPNSIEAGGSATLRWEVSGASTITINHGIGTVLASGEMTVRPSSTTDYQIAATNSDGNAVRTAHLYVGPSNTCSAALYPSGTTAVCNNGQLSQSQNRSGTCSQNGGVRCWICPGILCGG